MWFDVNNEPFEKYSLYFRNALVRANYTLIPKNITPTYIYLNKFFRNILIWKEKLDVKELYITRKL
jgi:hypothetical protein